MVLTDVGCSHTIQIVNLSENEIFSFPLIFIKGYITGNCHNCESAKNISVHHVNGQNVVNETLYCMHHDKFKILAYLNEGKNSFTFQCCSVRKDLVLFLQYPITSYVVKPVYVICKDHNGLFQAPEGHDNSVESACRRIGICAKLLQTIFAEKLYEHGYSRKTFQLDKDTECLTFYTNLSVKDAYSMRPHEIWEYLGREIMTSSIGSTCCKFLAFLSCTMWNGDAVYADVALGGGGLALFGTCCLYTWPTVFGEILSCFLNETKMVTRSFTDDGYFRRTYGACFSATLGAVCHELGHAFDLGHSKNGMMGSDYLDVDSVFTFQHLHNENVFDKEHADTSMRTTVTCMRNFSKRRVTFLMDSFTQELNISYCVPLVNRITNKNDSITRVHKQDKNKFLSNKPFPADRLFFTYSCATIVSYHKWFNVSSALHNDVNNLKYDRDRGIVRSMAGIVVVQLRDDEGYVVRSWEFLARNKKVLFLVPLCELRRSNVIFIEDVSGNIIKEEIQLVI